MTLHSDRKVVDLHSLMPLISAKLEQEGEVKIPARGNSMVPLFRHGRDQVFLQGVCGETLSKYDVILYRRPGGQYVLHRIVGVGKNGYILRGDGQLADEYPVQRDWVMARVKGICRDGRSYTCTQWRYRVYAVVWVNTVWLRRGLARLKWGLHRLKQKLVHPSGE